MGQTSDTMRRLIKGKRTPPWASPQDVREPQLYQVGSGLVLPTPTMLYEEVNYGTRYRATQAL
jgi:hypothetical protein